LGLKYEMQSRGFSVVSILPTPKKLMELQATINEDLLKASLPEIRIGGFRLPDQALEITFERETVTGENRDRLWEIINSHYKRLLRELELKE
jgi:hypothetical protein